ncbi:tRNA (guanosine(18)-2'-O)-methyltransferase [Yarrowia sp. C11]|nr:tRNA (guanosine(18)-2'-O)-methyltransferase [Yarrowia sp. C11]
MLDLLKKLDQQTLGKYANELTDQVVQAIGPSVSAELLGQAKDLQLLEEILDPQVFQSLVAKVADKCSESIGTCSESITVVSDQIPLLSKLLFEHAYNNLRQYISQPHLNYLVNVDLPAFEKTESDGSVDVETAAVSLNFLHSLVLNNDLGTAQLDSLLLHAVCLSDSTLVHSAAVLLKLRMSSVAASSLSSYLWPIVSNLVNSSLDDHKTVGYKLWLWWLSACDSPTLESDTFQSLFKTEMYWNCLLRPLKTTSYDHKKLALYIISRSVQHIVSDISLENMKWSTADREALLEQWKRFATLTEIIAIDSSYNQTVACEGDILMFLGPECKLAPRWGIALIAMGLNATMDTVRKYMAKVVLALPVASLAVFQHDFDFLESKLLPYLLEATHFQTARQDGQIVCIYGDTLEAFIEGLYTTFDKSRTEALTVSIFKLLNILREGFDPSKIYALAGVMSGLKATELQLSEAALDDFAPMLMLTSETGVRRKLQKLYLDRICLHFSQSLRVLKLLSQLATLETIMTALNFKLTPDTELRKSIEDLSTYAVYLYGSGEKCDIEEAATQLNLLPVGVSLGLKNMGLSGVPTATIDDTILSSTQATLALAKSDLSTANTDSIYTQLEKLEFSEDLDLAAAQLTLLAALNLKYGKGDFASMFEYLKSSHIVSRDLKPGQTIQSLNSVIAAKFDCLNTTLAHHKVTEPVEVVNFATLNYSVASSSESRYAIVACIYRVVEQLDTTDEKTCSVIQDTLFTIWDEIMSTGLVSSAKPVHLAFIELLLSKSVLQKCIENDSLAETVFDIASTLVSQCYARRSLLPLVAKKLLEFGGSEIVKVEGAHSLIIEIYTLQQIDDTNFRLEDAIASRYDTEMGIDGGSVFKDVHGGKEVAARALIAVLVSQITDSAFAELMWDEIFTSESYRLFNPKKMNDGKEERIRVQCYQLLTMTEAIVSHEFAQQETEKLITHIRFEPSPIVRMYMEWIIARVILKGDSLVILRQHLSNPEEIPRVLAAFQRIGLLIGEQIENVDDRVSYLTEYLNIVLPFCSSNRAAVRHFAVSMICAVGPWIQSEKFWGGNKKALETMEPLARICMGIFSHATRQEAYHQFRSGEKMLWNVHRYYNLVGICGGLVLRLSDREFPFVSETDFANLELAPTKPQVDLVFPLEPAAVSLSSGNELRVSVGANDKSVWASEAAVAAACGIEVSSVSAPVQTKSGAWNATLVEDNSEESRAAKINRGELILVASLVDKPPNLGGICRLSDVLGAQLLTLNDISVAKHPQFKNVAVTADQWMPMAEVKVEEIAEFMRAKKREGYTLIGLEQTDQSKQLNKDFVFPKKSLILLGMEREGIPGNLLAELDYAVEIKQIGMIRSMNIQTAAAVIVHAYSMQHCA